MLKQETLAIPQGKWAETVKAITRGQMDRVLFDAESQYDRERPNELHVEPLQTSYPPEFIAHEIVGGRCLEYLGTTTQFGGETHHFVRVWRGSK